MAFNKSNYTQIPNELIAMMPNLRESELKVILAIARKTYGWLKETDTISISQIEKMTGLGRSTICSVFKSKKFNNLVIVNKDGNINKYTLRISSSESGPENKEVVQNLNQGSSKSEPSGSSESEPTKETITKETKQKKYIPTLSEVKQYFIDNGYSVQAAKKAFNYYNTSLEDHPKRKYWRDSKDNKIKSWKMKMRAVWFKDENKKKGNSNTNTKMQFV